MSASVKPPVWFWVVVTIAILWNLIGVASYFNLTMMSPEALAEMPEAERALLTGYPAWATAAFAIAVFAGVAGSVLLLLRKALAVLVFGASLAAIVVQMTWWLGLSGAFEVYGYNSMVMPALVIIVAAFLLWFSMQAKTKGWIG